VPSRVIRLALRVPREDAELVLAELLELAPGGVEELELDDSLVEFAVYGAPGELPRLPDLRAAAGAARGALVEVRTSEVPDDWAERWKAFHRPVLITVPGGGEGISDCEGPGDEASEGSGGEARLSDCRGELRLYIRPPWEQPSDAPTATEIVIDPGQAFGTGAHHTTRMCLELLLELASLESARGPAIDVGCGSGVLAIAAARLGFRPVLGLDHEPESVQATRANAAANGVILEALRFDLRRESLPPLESHHVPRVMLANLVRPLLLDLAGSLHSPPGHLIASGLLREEADEVARVFRERLELREHERRQSGEWAALWLSSSV
jgi:ribosomal protein L11 methyltransferase